MKNVRAKKSLGQHFLKDEKVAQKIVNTLSLHNGYKNVLEIGAGMGVLTSYLLENKDYKLKIAEIDSESVVYLKKHFLLNDSQIIEADVLKLNLHEIFNSEPFAILGNLPYNISSQIFFKILEYKDQVPEAVCMIQKEVALRIAASPGGRVCGILSILIQAYYDVKYEFTVGPEVFSPPPKVQSAVISLKRNKRKNLPCDERWFFRIVKVGFGTRRKTLRNALKSLQFPENFDMEILKQDIFSKRAEQLSVEDFIGVTKMISE